MLLAAVLSAAFVTTAFAQDTSSAMAGTVEMKTPHERQLFERVLCQCGDCARLPLSTCVCGWAENKRADLRRDLAAGKTVIEIQDEFAEQYGAKAIAIPRDRGLDRALWAVPVVAILLAAGGITVMGRRWVKRSQFLSANEVAAPRDEKDEGLDRALDEDLRRLDD